MAKYVDGFVLCVPKKNMKAYVKLAKIASKVWTEHGALDYVEAIGDDLKVKFGRSFTTMAKPKKNEVVVFSYITFKSRRHRDAVNKKVMADKRMDCSDQPMPFDMKRLTYGGFTVLVEA